MPQVISPWDASTSFCMSDRPPGTAGEPLAGTDCSDIALKTRLTRQVAGKASRGFLTQVIRRRGMGAGRSRLDLLLSVSLS